MRRISTIKSSFLSVKLFVVIGLLAIHSSVRAAGDVWETKSPMPTARLGLAACAVDGKIYAIGGYAEANGYGLSVVEEYDPAADMWTIKTPMPTPRRWLSASAIDGRIYAIGGFRTVGTPSLSTVEEYDVATDTWTTRASMGKTRKGFSTAVLDGMIYAIGGADENEQRLTSVEMYDPATDTWSPGADMPTARAMIATAVLHGKIYAIGGPWPGDEGIATVEEYDPASDTWTTKTSMPTRRWGLTAQTVEGKIYAMGGAQGTSGLSAVDQYDPLNDHWISGLNMYYQTEIRGNLSTVPFSSWGLASTVVGNGIFVMGGASTGPPHPGTDTMVAFTPSLPEVKLFTRLIVDDQDRSLRLEWESGLGNLYALQFKETIDSPEWTQFKNINGTGEVLMEDLPVSRSMDFYRVVVELGNDALYR